MTSAAKFVLGNVFFGGKVPINAKNSNFQFFESALNMKSVSMPLTHRGFARCGTPSYAHDLASLLGSLFLQHGMEKKKTILLFWIHFIIEFQISVQV